MTARRAGNHRARLSSKRRGRTRTVTTRNTARRTADLYGLPPEEFTRARDELARELRKAGDKEAADEVKALRKPTVSAAVVNQLARRRPTEMRALVKAGEKLRNAQRGAVSGGDAEALRDATQAHRVLLDELTAIARHDLDVGGQTLPRVAQTLRAASIDKQASKTLLDGTLAADVEQAGFGPLLSAVPAPTGRKPRARPAKQAPAKPKPRKPPDRAREQTAKLREQLRKARGTAREERRTADAAAREAERAEKRAAKAEAHVDELKGQLDRISG